MNREMMGELSLEWIAWNYTIGADTDNSQLDEKTLGILRLLIATFLFNLKIAVRRPFGWGGSLLNSNGGLYKAINIHNGDIAWLN